MVIIGVAKTYDNRDPRYSLLWRQLGADGAFLDYDDTRSINVETNSGGSIQVQGIPGEFRVFSVSPGVYALDGAFATLREGGLSYFAQGVVERPERPSFEVRAGDAVFLGIWEMNIDGAHAVTRLWRLDEADRDAVVRAARIRQEVQMLSATSVEVQCAPHRMSGMSPRQIC